MIEKEIINKLVKDIEIKENLEGLKKFFKDLYIFLYTENFPNNTIVFWKIEKDVSIKHVSVGDKKIVYGILIAIKELLEKKDLIQINKKYANNQSIEELEQLLKPVKEILKNIADISSNMSYIKQFAREGTKLGASIVDAFNILDKIDVKRLIQIKKISESLKIIVSEIENKGNHLGKNFSIAINKKFSEVNRIFSKEFLLEEDLFDLKYFNNELLFINFQDSMDYDIYIDTSSSMGEYIDFNGQKIKKIDIAAAIAFHITNTKNELYQFSSSLRKIEDNIFDFLLRVAPAGGTNINKVLDEIQKRRKKGIIITDGEASIDKMTELADFIIIGKKYNKNITSFNLLKING